MNKIISTELLKMRYSKCMKICSIFIITLSAINVVLHMSRDEYGTMYFMSEIFGLVISALFSGLSISSEFGKKTIYHTLQTGSNRTQIYFAKYVSYIVSCFILLLVNAGMLFLTVQLLGKLHNDIPVQYVLVYVLAGIFYDLCLIGIFFLIGMLIKDSGVTVTIGIIISAFMIVSSEILWTDRTYPFALSKGEILSAIPILNLIITFVITTIIVIIGSFIFRKKEL